MFVEIHLSVKNKDKLSIGLFPWDLYHVYMKFLRFAWKSEYL